MAVKKKAPVAKSPKFLAQLWRMPCKSPNAIKDNNGGNPWEPEEIRKAVGIGQGNSWYALTRVDEGVRP